MIEAVVNKVSEAQYKAVEKKLVRVGFERKHYDTNGANIAKSANGFAFLSDRTNTAGDNLLLLLTHRGDELILQVVGFNTDEDSIVDTNVDGVYFGSDATDELIAIAAESLRVFLNSNKAASSQMPTAEANREELIEQWGKWLAFEYKMGLSEDIHAEIFQQILTQSNNYDIYDSALELESQYKELAFFTKRVLKISA